MVDLRAVFTRLRALKDLSEEQEVTSKVQRILKYQCWHNRMKHGTRCEIGWLEEHGLHEDSSLSRTSNTIDEAHSERCHL